MTQIAYISYTTDDLSDHMEAVKKRLEAVQLTPRITAASSARSSPTVDECYADIDSCVFLGLVGHRLSWETATTLTDMAGNVFEWCADWHGSYQPGHQANPAGPDEAEYRVLRAGSWINNARDCRSSYRLRFEPSDRDSLVGLRFAQVDQPRSDS